jgi:hypothetical protein
MLRGSELPFALYLVKGEDDLPLNNRCGFVRLHLLFYDLGLLLRPTYEREKSFDQQD